MLQLTTWQGDSFQCLPGSIRHIELEVAEKMNKYRVWVKFCKMGFLLFCIHYTFIVQIMYIGVAIAASAIKSVML